MLTQVYTVTEQPYAIYTKLNGAVFRREHIQHDGAVNQLKSFTQVVTNSAPSIDSRLSLYYLCSKQEEYIQLYLQT